MDISRISLPHIEIYILRGSLNASMLYNFLMGIYTMVFGGTVYVYLSKKPSNTSRRVVLTTISVLYMLACLNFILQWYFLDWSLVFNGQTRKSMFGASNNYPSWLNVILEFQQDFSLVISDGLLIWRCYHLWGKSVKIITVPSLLFVAELALSVINIVLKGLIPEITSAANTALEHNIATAFTFISLGTTVSATFLIGFRIHTASENVGRSRTRYNRIVATIVESSAVYSLVLLSFSMTVTIPLFYTVRSPLFQGQFYVNATLDAVTGLSPTVMVLRLALTNTNTVSSGTITHISGMDFNNSHQRSGGSGSVNTPSGEVTSSVHIESNEHGQAPVMDLTKESTTRDVIGQSPV